MQIDLQQYYAIAAVSQDILRQVAALARERLGGFQRVVTRFKSVELHQYWPCIVCGGHTGGVNVLNKSEDGTVRVCENCLWRITIARPENENLRSSNNSIV